MAEKDGITEQVRAREEEYFRKKDRELIERMRAAAEADRARRDLEEKTGLHDPELLRDLHELGFTPDTISLLPLVPIIQVAWAEGGVSDAERKLILRLARSRGIEAGSAADQQLAGWLEFRPTPDSFRRATRLISAMLDSPEQHSDLNADDLIKYCENIAAASGGILGVGRISADERATLTQIAQALKSR